MRIHNIYSEEDGETHFRDIDIEMSQGGPDGTTSKKHPLQEFISELRAADWLFGAYLATRRQYVINLDAPNQITASDGENSPALG